ncbi:adenylate kinase [Marchantia polymorpha subsp. ruderalis]|uniref:Adenylate kinase isoenzyme 6 homolog n=2 Tax=Marchantia polymorpha TaxID=3197 RepID=A0A176VIG8_MARPO|nr:hypothetical protein AXG93_411s1310 [Marchantia polymorpha subsp. ruderalis]PTQ46095.1 hypothetical protein MARPO_0012s0053 [Marchantia polymorpha]BBN18448.1 hypothetical protein Mp_8g02560 [Marchantia polymorpha subsp. ruderalis]|eukprot:PTQ46095.1 hypothetical protein MARPO_0012s0053 [Marchantia polymorpha]
MVDGQRGPNVLVTGTPGTGKTSTCALLASATRLNHINIGELVQGLELHDGWDDQLQCLVINEDLVIDHLEEKMSAGGNVVDYHGCDFFPERWFDVVVVLQTKTAVLYDRLSNRGYMDQKLQNNIECEIFQVLLEEARESYNKDIILALPSDTIEDMSNNVGLLKEWLRTNAPSYLID